MYNLRWYGFEKDEYESCLPQIKNYAHHMGNNITKVTAPVLWVLILVSSLLEFDKVFMYTYAGFASVFSILGIGHYLLKKKVSITTLYIYLILLFCFTAILSLLHRDSAGASFHVMLVVLPLLIIDKPIRTWLFMFFVTISYCIAIVILKSQSVWVTEIFNSCTLFVVGCSGHWITNRGKVKSFLLNVQNMQMIDELTIIRLALKEKAERDGMTKLYNRSKFQHEIQKIHEKVKEKDDLYAALFVLDVNKFKEINDIYGHHEGDKVLISVANVLLEKSNQHRVFARLGGDEFAGFYYGYCDVEKLKEDIEKVYAKLNYIEFKKEQNLSVSLGAVLYKQDEYQNFAQLYTLADKQMYNSKHSGQGISWANIMG